MRRSGRLGFTLIEMMVVVLIIGIGLALATFSINRNRQKVTVDRAAMDLKQKIERVRALAAVAGSRLGTDRIVQDATCTGAGWPANTQQMLVVVNPGAGTVAVPVGLVYSDANDTLTVFCETWNFTTTYGGSGFTGNPLPGQFFAPAGNMSFAFAPNGALVPVNVPAAGALIVIQHTQKASDRFGFRVLPSGVVCETTDPAPGVCETDA